jgi:pimeloyl-ACP methyl ester carboxylesterase
MTTTPPKTQHARSGDVHIAYRVFGEGRLDLIFVLGFNSNVDNDWEAPGFARWLLRLGSFARVTMFDKRGTGLSDCVSELPGMDQRMDDVRAVMDAGQIDNAAIMGASEGGSLACVFAAHHPERCQFLVLYGAFAQSSIRRTAGYRPHVLGRRPIRSHDGRNRKFLNDLKTTPVNDRVLATVAFTESIRRLAPKRLATPLGRVFWEHMTTRYVPNLPSLAASKSNPWAMAFSSRSTARRAPSSALLPFMWRCGPSA